MAAARHAHSHASSALSTINLYARLKTYRRCLLTRRHKRFIPPDQRIRQVRDKEDDPATRGSHVGAREEHADQETHHDGRYHENYQENDDDERVTVLEYFTIFHSDHQEEYGDEHDDRTVNEPCTPMDGPTKTHYLEKK